MPTNNKKNILIVRSGGMGDMLFMTPAISTIKKNFPSVRLSILIPPAFVEIFEGNKDVDAIIKNHYNMPGQMEKLVSFLRQYNFDLLINLNHRREYYSRELPKGLNITSVWSIIDQRDHPCDYQCKNLICQIWDARKHHVDNYLSLLRNAGLDNAEKELKFYFRPEDEKFAASLLASYGIEKDDLIVAFHPGTSTSNLSFKGIFANIHRSIAKKRLPVERGRWPTRHYFLLAELLQKRLKAKIIITGGRFEQGLGILFQLARKTRLLICAARRLLSC